MKRAIFAASLAALAVLVVAAPAAAAPALSIDVQRDQATLQRDDEFLSYVVKVKNTGTTPTTAPVNLSLAMPGGMTLGEAFGVVVEEWNCHLSAQTCTASTTLAPGAEFGALRLKIWIAPAETPGMPSIDFTAFGGGASADAIVSDSFVFEPAVPFGVIGFAARAEDPLGNDYTTAGGHPLAATSSFELPNYQTPRSLNAPVEDMRDIHFELPAGFIGNPQAAGICTIAEVKAFTCPASAAVGGIAARLEIFGNSPAAHRPLYRITPEDGYAAAFAFTPAPPEISNLSVVLRAKLRSNGDYGVTAIAPLTPQSPKIWKLEFAHLCTYGAKVGVNVYEGCKLPTDGGAFRTPFLTNPTRCAAEGPLTRLRVDSWKHPGMVDAEGFPDPADPNWKSGEAPAAPVTGCDALTEAWVGGGPNPARPSFSLQPDSGQAAVPAAYVADLHIPQRGLVGRNADGTPNREALATAHLKDTTVKLARGVTLNPAAAAGLGACSLAEAGYVGNRFPDPNPIHFNTTSVGCPANSKIGRVEVKTPLLDKVLHGSVYLAAQGANPFGSDFATYIVIEDPETGTRATLAGRVEPSESEDGQITARFEDNPQVPIEDIKVDFFGGPHASLANPDVCGGYTTHTELTPWSAKDPHHPTAAEIATSDDPTAVFQAPPGLASCPATKAERPFALGFKGGVTAPTAGGHSPFVLQITRPDGAQELTGISVTTPAGLAASLRGVAICPQSAIDLARSRSNSGDGATELANPSCPAASQVGTTTIGAGVGSDPFYVKTGKAYLTGPYKGAPLSLVFVVPAVAGPFDLGVQVVRTALYVDRKTAQVTAQSDPIPQMLEGVPLQIRDIRVEVDRPGFILNPTSCEEKQIVGQATGASGATASLSSRFQVGNCEALGFRPDLGLRLHGGTKRGDYQRLVATVSYPKGSYANIARAAVTLPHSAFLAQEHIRTVCTRVQFAAGACPPGSIYGRARAVSPLLDQPLTGPVYLRSSSNKLPDLVAALRGPDSQPIEVELAGRTDSVHGGIRNTFDVVPDAPVSAFTLELFGGKKSLIVNSRNLCKGKKQRATARFTGQNGRQRNFRPVVRNDCKRSNKRASGEKAKKKGRSSDR